MMQGYSSLSLKSYTSTRNPDSIYLQLLHVVQTKQSSIHQLSDAVPLHLQRLKSLQFFKNEAFNHTDPIAPQLPEKNLHIFQETHYNE